MTKHDLTGLRADKLVAFMAALGTLRASSLVWQDSHPKLAWSDRGDGWYASLELDESLSQDELIDGLHQFLQAQRDAPAVNLADDLTVPTEDFHRVLDEARKRAGPRDRVEADFLACFGSEAVQSMSNGKPSGKIADTAFRTMSGAGHQHFLGTMRTLAEDTTRSHLFTALFSPWAYSDPMKGHSLRWDPVDDVRYALQWSEPSGDPSRNSSGSMWGAYRLAIEALPLFPAMPQGSHLHTTGFTEQPGNTRLTWPVWDSCIDVETVRSLLALSVLQAESIDHAALDHRGIQMAFRCRRVTQGKFRNFTAAQPV